GRTGHAAGHRSWSRTSARRPAAPARSPTIPRPRSESAEIPRPRSRTTPPRRKRGGEPHDVRRSRPSNLSESKEAPQPDIHRYSYLNDSRPDNCLDNIWKPRPVANVRSRFASRFAIGYSKHANANSPSASRGTWRRTANHAQPRFLVLYPNLRLRRRRDALAADSGHAAAGPAHTRHRQRLAVFPWSHRR